MKFAFAAIVGVCVVTAPAAFAGPGQGEEIYEARCKMCHGSGMGGAPLAEKIAALEPSAVVEKMTSGTMAPMSAGISDEDKRNIAVFLTKKALPAAGGLPEVKP